MKVIPAFTLRRSRSVRLSQSSLDDATSFYRVIDRPLREFMIATWGAWFMSSQNRRDFDRGDD